MVHHGLELTAASFILIILSVTGTASVASAWSNYFDALVDKNISTFFRAHMPIDVEFIGSYPDFFAFGITIVLTRKSSVHIDLHMTRFIV